MMTCPLFCCRARNLQAKLLSSATLPATVKLKGKQDFSSKGLPLQVGGIAALGASDGASCITGAAAPRQQQQQQGRSSKSIINTNDICGPLDQFLGASASQTTAGWLRQRGTLIYNLGRCIPSETKCCFSARGVQPTARGQEQKFRAPRQLRAVCKPCSSLFWLPFRSERQPELCGSNCLPPACCVLCSASGCRRPVPACCRHPRWVNKAE
jgi:hypothetical protein